MSRKCKAWSEFGRDNPKHQNPLSKEAFAAGWDKNGDKMKLFHVLMRRYGNIEGHTYLAGCYDTLEKAIDKGREEHDYRGGKYEFQVFSCNLNNHHEKLEYDTCGSQLTHSEQKIKEANQITDGFGSYWTKTCSHCGQDTMEVVRPGRCQCSICG